MSMTQPSSPTDDPAVDPCIAPPEAPATPEETGLSFDQLTQLVLKVLYFSEATGTEVADRLHISYAVFDGFLQHARAGGSENLAWPALSTPRRSTSY